ncbi:hypothetical protein [Collimonas sp. OK242]|jgi:hypothetical protein|uniref:hypothetical protein n=1 Tax=Collimonas sp. OK242 TaxID=1798195 RepID=UPI0015A20905|nr:hypothetical protein [Collimonas sp. OK242]
MLRSKVASNLAMLTCAGAQLKTLYWLIRQAKKAAESGFIDMEQIPRKYRLLQRL